MALTVSALQALAQGTNADAWRVMVDHAIEIASKPLAAANAPSEVVKRDREIGDAGSVPFLQRLGFVASLRRQPSNALRIACCAGGLNPTAPRRVLILDGLSLA